jgi:hypothetical protein
MNSRLDEMGADTAKAVGEAARVRGISIDEYLRRLVPHQKTIDLINHGIDKAKAANLRARLKTFAVDWTLPAADIYDEDPPQGISF